MRFNSKLPERSPNQSSNSSHWLSTLSRQNSRSHYQCTRRASSASCLCFLNASSIRRSRSSRRTTSRRQRAVTSSHHLQCTPEWSGQSPFSPRTSFNVCSKKRVPIAGILSLGTYCRVARTLLSRKWPAAPGKRRGALFAGCIARAGDR